MSARVPWCTTPRATTTFVLVCLVASIQEADRQILPAAYLEVCEAFHAGPSALGMATSLRGIAEAVVAVFAGPLGDRHDRVVLIAGGAIFWGLATILVGASSTLPMLFVARTLTGLGLGMVMPLLFALVADLVPATHRGTCFGIVLFAAHVGGAAGGYLTTNLAASRGAFLLGVPGWRGAFHVVGLASCVIGLAFGVHAHEPRPRESRQELASLSMLALGAEGWQVLRVRTFALILAQGGLGTAPWNSMSFLTLFFELQGASHHAAALTRSLLDLGSSFGNLLGGCITDAASRCSPDHGRVIVAQVSVASGLVLFPLLFFVFPRGVEAAALMLLAGLLISWCQSVNNTIIADIVPPHLRTTIYGLDRMAEGTLGSVGGLASGWVAESVFGFAHRDGCSAGRNAGGASTHGASGVNHHRDAATRPAPAAVLPPPACPPDSSHANVVALGRALALTMCVPWALCFVAYTLLHWTYPVDRAACHQSLLLHDGGDARTRQREAGKRDAALLF